MPLRFCVVYAVMIFCYSMLLLPEVASYFMARVDVASAGGVVGTRRCPGWGSFVAADGTAHDVECNGTYVYNSTSDTLFLYRLGRAPMSAPGALPVDTASLVVMAPGAFVRTRTLPDYTYPVSGREFALVLDSVLRETVPVRL